MKPTLMTTASNYVCRLLRAVLSLTWCTEIRRTLESYADYVRTKDCMELVECTCPQGFMDGPLGSGHLRTSEVYGLLWN